MIIVMPVSPGFGCPMNARDLVPFRPSIGQTTYLCRNGLFLLVLSASIFLCGGLQDLIHYVMWAAYDAEKRRSRTSEKTVIIRAMAMRAAFCPNGCRAANTRRRAGPSRECSITSARASGNARRAPSVHPKNDKRRRTITKKIMACALLALSVLSGVASTASADPREQFGTRTAPHQHWSPN